MNLDTYLIFLVTTAVVCLTPGPAALLIVAQGISNGFRRSYWAIAGIALDGVADHDEASTSIVTPNPVVVVIVDVRAFDGGGMCDLHTARERVLGRGPVVIDLGVDNPQAAFGSTDRLLVIAV